MLRKWLSRGLMSDEKGLLSSAKWGDGDYLCYYLGRESSDVGEWAERLSTGMSVFDGERQDMSEKNSAVYAGATMLFGVLLSVFVVLKLFGVVDWSWWLVLPLLCGPLVVMFVVRLMP